MRAENDGYLVHMDVLIGARSKAGAEQIAALLKAGKDNAAHKLATGFADLMDPASPGAVQQAVLNAKPGYYVQACFMDTQDGREHTQLGMERVIRIANERRCGGRAASVARPPRRAAWPVVVLVADLRRQTRGQSAQTLAISDQHRVVAPASSWFVIAPMARALGDRPSCTSNSCPFVTGWTAV